MLQNQQHCMIGLTARCLNSHVSSNMCRVISNSLTWDKELASKDASPRQVKSSNKAAHAGADMCTILETIPTWLSALSISESWYCCCG